MFRRRSFNQIEHRLLEDTKRLKRRLLEEIKRLHEQAELLQHGPVVTRLYADRDTPRPAGKSAND